MCKHAVIDGRGTLWHVQGMSRATAGGEEFIVFSSEVSYSYSLGGFMVKPTELQSKKTGKWDGVLVAGYREVYDQNVLYMCTSCQRVMCMHVPYIHRPTLTSSLTYHLCWCKHDPYSLKKSIWQVFNWILSQVNHGQYPFMTKDLSQHINSQSAMWSWRQKPTFQWTRLLSKHVG